MAYPNELRTKLGISITAFANLIECHSSQLSMAESGRRNLPMECSTIITSLQKAIGEIADSADIEPLNTNEQTLTMLQKHIRICEAKIYFLTQKEEKLYGKMQQSKLMLQMANVLGESALPTQSGIANMQLQILTRKGLKKWKEHRTLLVRIQLSIAGLHAELKLAEELRK